VHFGFFLKKLIEPVPDIDDNVFKEEGNAKRGSYNGLNQITAGARVDIQ
jgi:hypothetical protein